MGPGLLALIPSVLQIVNKVIPDKSAAAKIQGEILLLQAKGEFSTIENQFNINLKQLEINSAEASNPNAPKFGWRSLVGYGCALAFLVNFVALPVLSYLLALFNVTAPGLVQFDMSSIIALLTGMLGIGGMKTYENYQRMSLDRTKLFNSIRSRIGPLTGDQVDAIDNALDEQKW